MTLLLPRIPRAEAEALVGRMLEEGLERWAGFNPQRLPTSVRFAASGGQLVSGAELLRLRRELVRIASRHGFGRGYSRSTGAGGKFDSEAAIWLADETLFRSGESLRDDTWSFIGAVLAPDIVHWRFGPSIQRYIGGIRNTFQRLWVRGVALDRGADHPRRWELLEKLSEDALVQITERPSLAADSVLAVAIGEAWLRAAQAVGVAAMESIMRRAALRIRVWNEVRALADLPPDELARALDKAFQ